MMQDIWLGRILAVSQLTLVIVCGVLIALGHNSVITDLFILGGGSLFGSSIMSKLKSKPTTYQSSEDAQ